MTGSRWWRDERLVQQVLAEWFSVGRVLLVGDCRSGVDAQARRWWRRHGGEVVEFVAEWSRYPRAAGPMRNQRMIDAGPDVCLAFLTLSARCGGTRDTVGRARQAGVPVFLHYP